MGDSYRDSSKTQITRKQFSTFGFHAFPDGPICDGSSPRSKLTFTTSVNPPTYSQDIPSSIASARNVEFFWAVSDYLQNDFLYNASSPQLQAQNFSDCLDYRVYTGHSGVQGECWIQASNDSRDILNRNVSYLTHILLAHALDLAAYRQNFSFMTPGTTSGGSIGHRDRQWRDFLSKVRLEEADQEDGSVKYRLSLDMDEFCKYGVQISDLVSK